MSTALAAPCNPPLSSSPTSGQGLHPMEVRRAVFALHPHASMRSDGGFFELPDGSQLSQRADGSWTLRHRDGVTSIQLHTLPQLHQTLQRALLVLPARLIGVLMEGSITSGALTLNTLADPCWPDALRDAEQLGLVARVGRWGWRLTERGRLAARLIDRDAFVVVALLPEAQETQR